MRLKEFDIRYSAFDKVGKMHKIGDVYGKKNLKVPHAKYVDKTNKQKKLLKK
jgi:hypothetical protein|tara:strand:- start:73 stop:228 length:156 start_codon:yes stop_codon:yes gene_type:complete